jgi:predicted PurR-regulated permease PerM
MAEVSVSRMYIFTQLLMLAALFFVLQLGLLPALLAGLLIYHLVEFGARRLARLGVLPRIGKLVLLGVLAVTVVAVVSLMGIMLASSLADGQSSLFALLQRMADVVDKARTHLPLWAQESLPTNIEAWQAASSEWLRENAKGLSLAGRNAGVFILHLIIGMIIGGMVALNPPGKQDMNAPLSRAFKERIFYLVRAFRRIVFSQVKISALNTALTGVFLLFVMPLLGHPLPLVKVMIVVTFVVGLLPIVGNLISNTVIFLISLSVSPVAAVMALAYLVIIHKLEYFINARIIGTEIRARAWEILLAMLVMEVAFGIAGLVAAAIYYAYIKAELSAQKLI